MCELSHKNANYPKRLVRTGRFFYTVLCKEEKVFEGENLMIRVAICDYDTKYLESVSALLNQYAEKRERILIVEKFETSSALLDRVEEGTKYDVYIMEINMMGVTGISVARELRERKIEYPIIFLASTSEFALQAFEVNATQYLLKTYPKERLFDALDKAMKELKGVVGQTILLKAEGEYHNIDVKQILYSESNNNYQYIYLKDGMMLRVRITSGILYEQLKGYGCFYRCGRTYILNVEQIRKLNAKTIVLSEGTNLTVPRSAMQGLKEVYVRYYANY